MTGGPYKRGDQTKSRKREVDEASIGVGLRSEVSVDNSFFLIFTLCQALNLE